ncbi:MAG: leucine-rich repeat domain-containing protein [Oscillospiraceae bacterium]|nr:leucine-rich repeat domain-containing protein [Oscillospiraceae bacterium]
MGLFLVFALIGALLPAAVLTASAESYSGTCGDNLTWTLDTENGVLEIFGTGDMNNYISYKNNPWYSYRQGIKCIIIGNGVASIGDHAFDGCGGLTSITIPDSVTSIGDHAFSGCEELTGITIPDSVTSIGGRAFSGCSGLTGITIPDSVTSIGAFAFSYCSGLTSVTIPDSVTWIGGSAFWDCRGMNAVYITDIAAWCRIMFNPYSSYHFTNPLAFAHDLYLNETLITDLVIPDCVTSIQNDAFYGCSSLTSVTIPGSVTSIGNYAFQNCTGLTDVYYFGSEAGWNRITIGSNNTPLTGATIHYLAEGLAINTASLTLYEDIVVNFTATVPEGLTNPYMVVELGEQSYTLAPSREDDQGRLVFDFMNLTPDKMGDNIKATLYATTEGGQLVHFCKPEYSIKQYCTNVMAAYPENEKLQVLLADLLLYGAATQRFTGYNADALVTEGMTLENASTFADLTSTDFARTGAIDPEIQWTGAGLECGSQMSMYFTLNTTVGAATSVEVTINGRTTVYAYEDMATDDTNTCRVVFRGISASEYGDVVTAILKNNGEQVGQTLTYSVNSYVYSKQNDTAVENLAQLVKAIYNYGKSAKDYLN